MLLIECGGELSGPNGVIDFNETTSMHSPHSWKFKCEWNITVKLGRTIEVTFSDFTIDAGVGGVCKDNYILVRKA